MAAEIDMQRTPPKTSHRPLQQRRLRTNDDLDQAVDCRVASSTSTLSGLSVAATGAPTNSRPIQRAVGAGSTSSAAASAAGSPRKSWEETFQSLSRNLQTICGSNGSIDEASTSPVNANVQRLNSPVMIAAAVVWNGHDHHIQQYQHHHRQRTNGTCDVSGNGDGTPRQPHHPNGSHVESPSPMCRTCSSAGGGAGMTTRNSFPFSPTGNVVDARLPPLAGTSPPVAAMSPMRLRPGWRIVRVLHEETTDRLRQSLTKICLQNNGIASPSTSTSDGLNHEPTERSIDESSAAASKSRQVRMKESLKSGVRVRLDLVQVGCDPDYVVVSVRDVDRVLTVWNAASVAPPAMTVEGGDEENGNGDSTHRRVLATVVLPKQTKINSLGCFVTDAHVLYVRERTTELMHVEVEPPDTEIFLPIFREDEVHLTVAMTLHIDDDYVIENSVVIRTIDDRLVVKGRRHRRHSGQETDEGPMKSFTLMLALPEGTYSRTVRAAYAPNENQLIVTALRAPASRRMTCAF